LRGYVLMRFGMAYSSTAAASRAPGLFFSSGETITVIGVVLLLLGLSSLLLAWWIGGAGIRRIRNSEWRQRGFLGAYIAYICPQVLLLTFLVSKILLIFLGVNDSFTGAPIVVSLITIMVIAGGLNYFLIKYRWIALHRGAPEPPVEPLSALGPR